MCLNAKLLQQNDKGKIVPVLKQALLHKDVLSVLRYISTQS